MYGRATTWQRGGTPWGCFPSGRCITSCGRCAYPSLAHLLEHAVEMRAFAVGMKVGYDRVKTLVDESVRNCKRDIGEVANAPFGSVESSRDFFFFPF